MRDESKNPESKGTTDEGAAILFMTTNLRQERQRQMTIWRDLTNSRTELPVWLPNWFTLGTDICFHSGLLGCVPTSNVLCDL